MEIRTNKEMKRPREKCAFFLVSRTKGSGILSSWSTSFPGHFLFPWVIPLCSALIALSGLSGLKTKRLLISLLFFRMFRARNLTPDCIMTRLGSLGGTQDWHQETLVTDDGWKPGGQRERGMWGVQPYTVGTGHRKKLILERLVHQMYCIASASPSRSTLCLSPSPFFPRTLSSVSCVVWTLALWLPVGFSQ